MSAVPDPDRLARLGQLGPPYLALVLIEFLLGMLLNLFAALPSGSPTSILAASPLLDVHVAIGVLLLGIGANSVRLASATRSRAALVVSSVGVVSGVGAVVAGMAFAFGSQSPLASFAMSVGFVGLLVAAGYLTNLRTQVRASRTARTAPPAESRGG